MLFFVDIDGTLADLKVRYTKAPKPAQADKAAFQQWVDKVQDGNDMIKDNPVFGMFSLLTAIAGQSHTIVYLTGRSENYRTLTVAWLKLHDFPQGELIMRENNDWRKPSLYKEEAIKNYFMGNTRLPFVAIDDDYDGCCSEMYKRQGATHLKVM